MADQATIGAYQTSLTDGDGDAAPSIGAYQMEYEETHIYHMPGNQP